MSDEENRRRCLFSDEQRRKLRRQREAVLAYAKAHRLEVIQEFYDAAVSGADPIDARTAFTDMMAFCGGAGRRSGHQPLTFTWHGGPKVVLVEIASRFARDLIVQLTGQEMMKKAGIELIPVDAPDFFTDPTPTAEMVRQILGAVAQFEKANLVAKLKHARDRKRAETSRCEGRKPVPPEVIAEARRLARRNPKTGERRSLQQIADELAELGYLSPSGKAYFPGSIKKMLAKASA